MWALDGRLSKYHCSPYVKIERDKNTSQNLQNLPKNKSFEGIPWIQWVSGVMVVLDVRYEFRDQSSPTSARSSDVDLGKVNITIALIRRTLSRTKLAICYCHKYIHIKFTIVRNKYLNENKIPPLELLLIKKMKIWSLYKNMFIIALNPWRLICMIKITAKKNHDKFFSTPGVSLKSGPN